MHQFNLTFAKAELQESLQAIVSIVSPRLYTLYNDVIAVWPPCMSNRKSKLTGEHGSNFFVSEIIIRPTHDDDDDCRWGISAAIIVVLVIHELNKCLALNCDLGECYSKGEREGVFPSPQRMIQPKSPCMLGPAKKVVLDLRELRVNRT